MKIMRKSIGLFLCVSMLLSFTAWAQEETANEVSWNYDNSIEVTVSVNTEKTFTPDDFPEIPCESVIIADKTKTEQGYNYGLILILDLTRDINPETAIRLVSKNQMVTKSDYNSYTNSGSQIHLNYTENHLKVGETLDFRIKEAHLEDHMYDYQGVVFTIDRETIDDSAISINSFSAYGIELFWADNGEGNTIFTTRPAELLGQRSENGIYYGTVKGAASAETQSARTINVVNTLAQTPGFVSVSLVREWAGIGFGWGSEKWENSDPQVAAMEVHGGYDNPLYVPHFVMDRTATVTGLKPGLTYITVKRNVGHPTGKEVSSVCPLYVYIPGDVDANGTVTTSDALQALQAAVGKIPLTETQTLAADIDGDKKISTADALKILQAAVGKIKLD